MAKEVNPRLVFDRLFASRNRDESAGRPRQARAYRKSILDFVTDDAQQPRAGSSARPTAASSTNT